MSEKTAILTIEFNTKDAVANIQKAQKEIALIKEETKLLQEEEKKRLALQDELIEAGKINSEEYKSNAKELDTLNKAIIENGSQLRLQNKEVRENNKVLDQAKQFTDANAGSIEQLRTSLSDATKRYNQMSAAERDSTKAGKELQAQIKGTSDNLKELEGNVGNTTRNVGNYGDALKGLGGPIGATVTGVKGFNTALKANPVISVVGLLMMLFNALKSNAAVADQITFITAGFNKVLTLLKDKVVDLIEPLKKVFTNPKQALIDLVDFMKNNLINRFKAFGVIVDGILSMDVKKIANGFLQFGSGVEDVIGKVENMGKAIGDASKEGYNASKAMDDMVVSNQKLNNEIKLTEKQIDSLTKSLKDKTKTEQERIDIANKIADLEITNATKQATAAKGLFDAEALKLKGKKKSAEEIAKLSELETNVSLANSDKQIAQSQRQTRINILLDKEEKRELKDNKDTSVEDEAKANRKKNEDFIKDEAKYQEELKKLEESKAKLLNEFREKRKEQDLDDEGKLALKRQKELDYLISIGAESNDITRLKNDWIIEDDKRVTAAKKIENDQQVANEKAKQEAMLSAATSYSNGLIAISEIIGRDTAEGAELAKAAALFQIGIDMARSISALTAASAGNPLNGVTAGLAGATQFAAGIASILANIAQAKKLLTAEPPKMAFGGNIEGNSHSNGGTLIEAEKGEVVINKFAVARHWKTLSDINQSTGGRAIYRPKFALGGNVDGGFTTRQTVSGISEQAQLMRQLSNDIANIKVVARVTDINRVQGNVIGIRQDANLR
jgi:hypothetical protein